MRRWLVVPLVVLAGCGGAEQSAELVVRGELDRSRPYYIDGVRQEVEVRPVGDDDRGLMRPLGGDSSALFRLAPGEYVVTSYTAFCGGSICEGDVRRRAYFCQKRVRVDTRTRITVRYEAETRCSID